MSVRKHTETRTPEKIASDKAKRLRWYYANRERAKAANQAWHSANRARVNAKARAWAKANPDKKRAWHAQWRRANPEKIKANAAAYRTKHGIRIKANHRRNHLRYKFNLTIAEFNRLLKKQRGKCAICGTKETSPLKCFVVDHDHSTGAVRGLLCFHCNAGIGHLKDDPLLLRAAYAYLKKAARTASPKAS